MGLFKWLFSKQKEAETPDSLVAYEKQEASITEMSSRTNFKVRAILSNGTITVYCPSGDIYSETGVDKGFYDKVLACTSEKEIKELFQPVPEFHEREENEEEEGKDLIKVSEEDSKALEKDLPEMLESGEFVTKGKSIFLKGVNLEIPKVLASEMRKAAEEDTPDRYNALKNFWYWCALNPDSQAREDLFPFLMKAGFKITPNGNFLARRAVKKVKDGKTQDKGLTEFVSNQWLRVKKNKKSPKNYYVFSLSDGGYKLDRLTEEGNTISLGTLDDLYHSISSLEDNEYTDMHTKKMVIKIGQEVSMERSRCDSDPHSACSSGLHVSNHGYNIQGYGDTVILVTVNPMNVVAVPRGDNWAKMRVCAYMPLAVVENDQEALEALEDLDAIQIEDTYFADQVAGLEKKVSKLKFEDIDTESVKEIVKDFKAEAATILKARVVKAK